MRKILFVLLAVGVFTACNRKVEQACEPIYDRSDFVEVTEVIPDAMMYVVVEGLARQAK